MGLTMFLTGTFKQKAKYTSESVEIEQTVTTTQQNANTSEQHVLQTQAKQTTEPTAVELQTTIAELKAQIAKAEQELFQIKAEIEALRAIKASIIRTQQLSKIYAGMQPETAASILCELEGELTVQILSQMNDRTAGKIMDAIVAKNSDYGAAISKLMAAKSKTVFESD